MDPLKDFKRELEMREEYLLEERKRYFNIERAEKSKQEMNKIKNKLDTLYDGFVRKMLPGVVDNYLLFTKWSSFPRWPYWTIKAGETYFNYHPTACRTRASMLADRFRDGMNEETTYTYDPSTDRFVSDLLEVRIREENILIHGWTEVDFFTYHQNGDLVQSTRKYDAWAKDVPVDSH